MKTLNAVILGAALALSGAAFAAGTIAGTVSFEGTAPKMEPLKRTSDAFCAKTKMNDEIVLVHEGGLENVVVRIKNGPAEKAPAKSVMVEQKDCMYRPRVQAAVEGQKVEIKNDDPTLHNVHSYEGTKTLFNQAQPPKSAPIEKAVPASGSDVLKLKCDVHPWMTGYVVFSKGPSAVSAEGGKFEIKDVPPGTYTVEAWHEKLGTKTAQVKVEDGKTADPKFAYAAK